MTTRIGEDPAPGFSNHYVPIHSNFEKPLWSILFTESLASGSGAEGASGLRGLIRAIKLSLITSDTTLIDFDDVLSVPLYRGDDATIIAKKARHYVERYTSNKTSAAKDNAAKFYAHLFELCKPSMVEWTEAFGVLYPAQLEFSSSIKTHDESRTLSFPTAISTTSSVSFLLRAHDDFFTVPFKSFKSIHRTYPHTEAGRFEHAKDMAEDADRQAWLGRLQADEVVTTASGRICHHPQFGYQRLSSITSSKAVAAVESLFEVVVPNLDQIHVTDILQLSESKAAHAFRQKAAEVARRVTDQAIADGGSEIRRELQDIWIGELFKELSKSSPTREGFTATFGLGILSLFPAVSLAATGVSLAKDAVDLIQDGRNWHVMVTQLASKVSI